MTYTIIDPNLIHTDLVRITIALCSIAIMLGVHAIASHKRRKRK